MEILLSDKLYFKPLTIFYMWEKSRYFEKNNYKTEKYIGIFAVIINKRKFY